MVLHVPRVDHLAYPSHPHLTFISRDELASLFYEMAMLWGGTLNFSTTEFTKGPRFLNMVMTFVLTSRSHYNTIIEPRAHFLLSLLEGLSINFSLHMIKSIIDCYHDMAIRDKLIFLLVIMRILTHMHITFHFLISMSCATQLAAKQLWVEPFDATLADPIAFSSRPFSSSAPSSLSWAAISLVDIIEQL